MLIAPDARIQVENDPLERMPTDRTISGTLSKVSPCSGTYSSLTPHLHGLSISGMSPQAQPTDCDLVLEGFPR